MQAVIKLHAASSGASEVFFDTFSTYAVVPQRPVNTLICKVAL